MDAIRNLKAALLAAAIAGSALACWSLPAEAASTACYLKAADGTCLDDTTPTTGQYTTIDGVGQATGLRSSQAHGVTKLTEATYIFAHNICRWVDNASSHGAALFIGLETATEWKSFINQPPAGASLAYCCQPASVSVCGVAKTINFAKSGGSVTLTGGYNYKAVYTCGVGVTGAAPTLDTSWTVVASGACAAPQETTGCQQNLHESADCVSDDGTATQGHDGGTRGNHSGSNGDGPGNSGGSNDG